MLRMENMGGDDCSLRRVVKVGGKEGKLGWRGWHTKVASVGMGLMGCDLGCHEKLKIVAKCLFSENRNKPTIQCNHHERFPVLSRAQL